MRCVVFCYSLHIFPELHLRATPTDITAWAAALAFSLLQTIRIWLLELPAADGSIHLSRSPLGCLLCGLRGWAAVFSPEWRSEPFLLTVLVLNYLFCRPVKARPPFICFPAGFHGEQLALLWNKHLQVFIWQQNIANRDLTQMYL